MTVHLIKLCVGVESLEELARWQAGRIAALKKKRAKPELMHVTRNTPKRTPEILDGGSLYWVIKGQIAARQQLIDIREVRRKNEPPKWATPDGIRRRFRYRTRREPAFYARLAVILACSNILRGYPLISGNFAPLPAGHWAMRMDLAGVFRGHGDRKSTRLNSSHRIASRMPSSA